MIDPLLPRAVLGAYSALLMAGGVMGYVKARSRISLIAGIVSGLVGIAAVFLFNSGRTGYYLGIALPSAMIVLFGGRYLATRKFMPSGMLVVISIVVFAIMQVSFMTTMASSVRN